MILSQGREAFICSWFFVQKRWLWRNSIKSLQQLVEKESHRYLQTAFCVCHQHSQFPQLCDPSKHQKASNLITGKDQKSSLGRFYSALILQSSLGNFSHASVEIHCTFLVHFVARAYLCSLHQTAMLFCLLWICWLNFFSASFCLQILQENQKTYLFFLLLTVVMRKELSGEVSV